MCAMKFRAFLCLAAVVALPFGLQGAEEPAATPTPTPKPSLFHRLTHPLEGTDVPKSSGGKKGKDKGKDDAPVDKGPVVSMHGIELGLLVDPETVKVPDVRQIKVTLTLTNRAKKMQQLDFPTTQRIEVLLKNKDGKMLEQWSQDQAFTNEPSMVSINPNERLEYSVNISTRDMAAGQQYSIEGFFPNYEQLKKVRQVSAK
jgi:hypothetical protein